MVIRDQERITRRHMLAATVAGCGALAIGRRGDAAEPVDVPRTGIGLASNVFDLRRAAEKAAGKNPGISDPLEFLKECRRLGAGGMQAPLGVRDEAYATNLRRFAEEHGLYIEASIALPQDDSAIERFEVEVLTAKSAGVSVARTVVFPGRRYETFHSPEQFAIASRRAAELLQRAEPVIRKHQLKLAVENHKDQRVPERLDLLRRLGSEYVGICVDVGNSFALCEDPIEVVKAYAPLAWSAHFKDQAVQESEDGFLFADIQLGKGFFDLPAMAKLLREANPHIRLNLEVMTRDPLHVPVFTAGYWSSLPDVRAGDLARTMRTVKAHSYPGSLPAVSNLPRDQQVHAEITNVTESLLYARNILRL